MIPVRKSVIVKEGWGAVELLLTPHLYSYKDRFGITFEASVENTREVLEVYADIFFLAAVNAWELDGRGTVEDFPLTRGDFHAWSVQAPKEFGKCVTFAVSALTGKTPVEMAAAATEKKGQEAEESKKKPSSWIGRLLRRF